MCIFACRKYLRTRYNVERDISIEVGGAMFNVDRDISIEVGGVMWSAVAQW